VNKSSSITILPLEVRHVRQLSKLFNAALEADFSYIDDLHRTRIRRQHSIPRLARAALRSKRHIFIAWQDRVLIGYVIAGTVGDGSGNIDWLYVRPGTRGNNLGLRLLSRAMQQINAQGATTVTLITYAYTSYYARQGFKLLRKVESDGMQQDLMRFEF
jgi:N-acetylglutamate synthase-like GNAT family acetyltransferase